jgi:GT2 family glycosyltransferase/glycosyltransferase involved in cell wall biosynthesis
MTETFRELSRNMRANEERLRTNPADRSGVDDPAPIVVSVVIVNYKGADDTIECLHGLRRLDWPAVDLELIVVDNASGDDSAARIRAVHPDVTLIEHDRNSGFAGGCNRGAAAAHGQYLAFINNDARPDPAWLVAAVAELETAPDVACVASRVLDWDGETIDFVDAALSFYGHGFKLHVGEPARNRYDEAHDVLFATGAAMVVRVDVFASSGGFDERFFMFFEDVDFGWRLWLLGWRVRYVPESVVFHRHHASMAKFKNWREQYLLERNALFTIYKNYDDANLSRALPAALALSARRGIALGGVDAHALDLERGVDGEGDDTVALPKTTAASLFAIDAFVESIGSLRESRDEIQRRRQRGDHELTRLFRLPLHPNIDEPSFTTGFAAVVAAMNVDEMFGRRRRIAIATGDSLTPRMAGPAIRAWQIALSLSREHDVKLVSTVRADLQHPDFDISVIDPASMAELEAWCDVFVFQGYILHEYPVIRDSKKIIVCDIYDPFHLEQLEQARDLGEKLRKDTVLGASYVLNQQLTRGDFFLCASDKQRDFWLGQLAAVGRINPANYDASPDLSKLIQLAPFGVSDEPPRRSRAAIKGVVPGIGLDDEVILWGGGIYNWFDPLTLIRAVDKLRVRRPNVRLFFLGVQHPNPNVPEMRMVVEARALADELALTDRHVFFNEQWVAYDDRENYLLDADIGVSTHFHHVETEFSFRTRILDYLWAGLPFVTTSGDSFADLTTATPLGLTVPPEDVDALEAALHRLLDDGELREQCGANARRLADRYRWSTVLAPIVEFCRDPQRAPDLLAVLDEPGASPRRSWKDRGGLRQDVRIVSHLFKEGGLGLTARKALGRARRMFTARP